MTASTVAPIVIAGAGECGTRAAFALREEGWDGRVILAGAEPSPPYERPPLSKTGELKPICDEDALREAGITFLPGTEMASVDTAAHVLELADGRRLPYRSLLLATGARARRLPFGGAPVGTADGIVVDARFATSAPDVFAAGDCCRYPHPLYDDRPLRLESWRAAQEHGAAAARAMLGGTEPYAGVPWFWTDQHDYTLQVAGLTDAAACEVVRVRPDGVEIWFGLDGGGRLVAAAAAGPGNSVARDIRLAEMLIVRRATPEPAALADSAIALKSVLRSPVAS